MLQGTGSDVGKSLMVAGLCRAFTRRGLKVAPFKPQNMSNNAAVTPDGGEIGRAQALQALACGLAPSVNMNPVLLKPQSATGAQIILQGKMLQSCQAADYGALKTRLMPSVLDSFQRVGAGRDLVLVEGAGSAAEINLRAGDIANMGFAEAADLPVILVGDIERGGVIAQLIGTHSLLPPAERERIKGFIVNKFRGDPSLFADGMTMIAERSDWRAIGLVPWFTPSAQLPAEDSQSLTLRRNPGGKIRIIIPLLPHIANFDDFDPLAAEPDIDLCFILPGQPLPRDAQLIILPGSKASLQDLAFLRAEGWDIDLYAHHRQGGIILGICGGYQMLGTSLADPDGIEGPPAQIAGLGLLQVDTVLRPEKTVRLVTGQGLGAAVSGYEIHLGATSGADCARPFLELAGRADGAISADRRVMGGYLHGLFTADSFRRRFLAPFRDTELATLDYAKRIETILDELALHLESHLDLELLLGLARAGGD